MAANSPVIVVHGIQGSWLKDQYPVNYQDSTLWTGILRRNFGALHLHSLDASVDAEPTLRLSICIRWTPRSTPSRHG